MPSSGEQSQPDCPTPDRSADSGRLLRPTALVQLDAPVLAACDDDRICEVDRTVALQLTQGGQHLLRRLPIRAVRDTPSTSSTPSRRRRSTLTALR
jgi:hypothetical protein